eukprot:16202-Prymnesium_polylepis.1
MRSARFAARSSSRATHTLVDSFVRAALPSIRLMTSWASFAPAPTAAAVVVATFSCLFSSLICASLDSIAV